MADVLRADQWLDKENAAGRTFPTQADAMAGYAYYYAKAMIYYVGIYESDDMKANKDCNSMLVFGEQVEPRVHQDNKHEWKHISLPCPHCVRTHGFKRSFWFEHMPMPSSF
jgi:hypothetical protein